MDPEEYEKIFGYLSDKKYPNDIKESEKRRIRKMSYKFDTNCSSNNLILRITKNRAKIIKLGPIMFSVLQIYEWVGFSC